MYRKLTDLSSIFSLLGRQGRWTSLSHWDVERLHECVIEMVALHYLLVQHDWRWGVKVYESMRDTT